MSGSLWSGGERDEDDREAERSRSGAPPGWLPPTDGAPAPDPAPEPPRAPAGWAPPVERPPGEAAPWTGGVPGAPAAPAAAVQAVEFWPRVGAAVIDFFVRFALVLAGALVGALLSGGSSGDEASPALVAGVVVGAIAGLAYAPIMIARTGGQTVGHKAMDTKIVRRDGSALGGGGAFVREVAVKSLLIEAAGGFFFLLPVALNYLWPLWDKDNEALHDKICSTRVVAA